MPMPADKLPISGIDASAKTNPSTTLTGKNDVRSAVAAQRKPERRLMAD
jgi:hypothetical protein